MSHVSDTADGVGDGAMTTPALRLWVQKHS